MSAAQNPVHKNMETFNKPQTHKDRKKSAKNGEVKHKGKKHDDI